MDLIKVAEQAFAGEKKEFPAFKAGDQITVGYRIKEGNKERVQEFRGDVICIHGSGDKKRRAYLPDGQPLHREHHDQQVR